MYKPFEERQTTDQTTSVGLFQQYVWLAVCALYYISKTEPSHSTEGSNLGTLELWPHYFDYCPEFKTKGKGWKSTMNDKRRLSFLGQCLCLLMLGQVVGKETSNIKMQLFFLCYLDLYKAIIVIVFYDNILYVLAYASVPASSAIFTNQESKPQAATRTIADGREVRSDKTYNQEQGKAIPPLSNRTWFDFMLPTKYSKGQPCLQPREGISIETLTSSMKPFPLHRLTESMGYFTTGYA